MKKIIVAALVAATAVVPSTATASIKGAERALEREIRWDYYDDIEDFSTYCRARSGHYTCSFYGSSYGYPGCPVGTEDKFFGKARVYQYGRRYSISYRFRSC